MSSTHRKVIIIGSGPAGLTASIYASRANLQPLLIEGEPAGAGDMPGGQLMNTTEIENYPGVSGVMGPDLMLGMREQAVRFGTEVITRRVTKVDFAVRPLRVWMGEDEYTADTIVASTGAKPLTLGLEREWDLMGHGVSTCATCDGFFFRDNDIVVAGGGDTAMEEAIFLTKFASTVTVVHRRDRLRASQVMQARAMANPKIKFRWNTQVADLVGDKKLEAVLLKDTVTGEESRLDVSGLFVAIGHKPNSELFEGQLALDANGYVVTTDGVVTSVPGVYAAGDLQDNKYRQAITSAGTGCMAALEAQAYLEELESAAPAGTPSSATGAPVAIPLG